MMRLLCCYKIRLIYRALDKFIAVFDSTDAGHVHSVLHIASRTQVVDDITLWIFSFCIYARSIMHTGQHKMGLPLPQLGALSISWHPYPARKYCIKSQLQLCSSGECNKN